MEIESFINGELWIGFYNKEMDWNYVLIEYWSWSGVWVDVGEILYSKKIEVLKWR